MNVNHIKVENIFIVVIIALLSTQSRSDAYKIQSRYVVYKIISGTVSMTKHVHCTYIYSDIKYLTTAVKM